jgi:hypothetical protein
MKDLIEYLIKEKFESPEDNVVIYYGKKKCYAIINTTSSKYYDDTVAVSLCEESELSDVWDGIDLEKAKSLKVGETLSLENNNGSLLVRLS